MGLTRADLTELAPVLKKSKSVLSLGYPELNISRGELKTLFGVSLQKQNPVYYDLPDTQEFFLALGIEFQCSDVKVLRGCEFIADLNQPTNLPQADLVIDPGTLEHCFNIGQAAINAANAVTPGGFIFHSNPVSMTNHGFYCLSPTWYRDWYTDNGWEVVQYLTNGEESIHIHPTKRVIVQPELSNLVLASKPRDYSGMKWPVQSKYKKMLA